MTFMFNSIFSSTFCFQETESHGIYLRIKGEFAKWHELEEEQKSHPNRALCFSLLRVIYDFPPLLPSQPWLPPLIQAQKRAVRLMSVYHVLDFLSQTNTYICFQVFVCDSVRISQHRCGQETPKQGQNGFSVPARMGLTLDSGECDTAGACPLSGHRLVTAAPRDTDIPFYSNFYCREASRHAHYRWLNCKNKYWFLKT